MVIFTVPAVIAVLPAVTLNLIVSVSPTEISPEGVTATAVSTLGRIVILRVLLESQ